MVLENGFLGVTGTKNAIERYEDRISEIEQWLKDETIKLGSVITLTDTLLKKGSSDCLTVE